MVSYVFTIVIIMYIHTHTQVDELRTQLTQIEHTTTNKCQDLEDAVEDFHHKVHTQGYCQYTYKACV